MKILYKNLECEIYLNIEIYIQISILKNSQKIMIYEENKMI
ncbi:hypothetical protein pb186bvf_016059 [Paramecium bursaria]